MEKYCPGCKQQTTVRMLDVLPALKFTREVFWCRRCRQWFEFSRPARLKAVIASITSIILPTILFGVYAASTGTKSIGGWSAIGLLFALVALSNLASAWTLVKNAELVGPIDYSP